MLNILAIRLPTTANRGIRARIVGGLVALPGARKARCNPPWAPSHERLSGAAKLWARRSAPGVPAKLPRKLPVRQTVPKLPRKRATHIYRTKTEPAVLFPCCSEQLVAVGKS